MIIYLLRHAHANKIEKNGSDAERALSPEGQEKMKCFAEKLSHVLNDIDLICTSPLKRAVETAKILSDEIKLKAKIVVADELQPGFDHSALMKFITDKNKSGSKEIVMVGHEPDLSGFASYLLGAHYQAIEFKKASLCCIEYSFNRAVLRWHVYPKLLLG